MSAAQRAVHCGDTVPDNWETIVFLLQRWELGEGNGDADSRFQSQTDQKPVWPQMET